MLKKGTGTRHFFAVKNYIIMNKILIAIFPKIADVISIKYSNNKFLNLPSMT